MRLVVLLYLPLYLDHPCTVWAVQRPQAARQDDRNFLPAFGGLAQLCCFLGALLLASHLRALSCVPCTYPASSRGTGSVGVGMTSVCGQPRGVEPWGVRVCLLRLIAGTERCMLA